MNAPVEPISTLAVPRRIIVGVAVAALRQDEAIALLEHRILGGDFTKVGFLNAHISNIACADARLMRALDGFLVLPDGVGVDIASKLLYAETFPDNLNGTDFVPALLKSIGQGRPFGQGLSVGLLGASPENVAGAAKALAAMAPQHRFHVVSDGFFSPLDEPKILAKLAEMRPDILLVAMGVPKQELFIADRTTDIHATCVFAVGALLDFLSGAVPRAPQWMRSARLEWLFRLVIEPGRLWRRYMLGNPIFLLHVISQKLTGAWSRR